LLVENLMSDPTTPEHLVQILHAGHLDTVAVCLDLGHAHVTVGVPDAIATLHGRIASVHVHDNHGQKDEHLWPGDGAIDWPATVAALKTLPEPPATVLELHQSLAAGDSTQLRTRIEQAFALLA
jgi:sugar phosphate isomerase/epimerase